MRHDVGGTRHFTKDEAASLVGKQVRINSGETLPVVGVSCQGPNRYCVCVPSKVGNGHTHEVHKSHKNALYVVSIVG